MVGIQQHVLEVSVSGINRKQRSITRLFPDFGDKVKGVADKGGIRLVNLEPGVWHWKIHSGTKDNVWYDADLVFKDVEGELQKHIANRRLWTIDKKHADLRKVAKKLMFSADIQIFCSCPAFQYWGPAHILSLSKYDAHARGTEPRPPKIRNPKQYGAVCKHLQTLLNVFPWYQTDMAKWLRDYYTEFIRDLEDRSSAQYGEVQRVAGELGRRQERPSRPQPELGPEVEEPVEPTEPVEPEVEEPEAEAPETEKPTRRPRRRRRPRRPGEEEEEENERI